MGLRLWQQKKETAEAMIEAAVANHGTINGIFNNAGITVFLQRRQKKSSNNEPPRSIIVRKPCKEFFTNCP
jgi:short-subunit dehydrogenase involved in D-alanine esterification of teichoic acids